MIQQELQWSEASSCESLTINEKIISNIDGECRLGLINQNAKECNCIRFKVESCMNTKGKNKLQVMVGLCDYKVRKERGMLFKDKSNIGHGLYLISSSKENAYLFSNIDSTTNYEELRFNINSGDIITLEYHKDQLLLDCGDSKQVWLDIETGTPAEDLFFCAIASVGSISIL